MQETRVWSLGQDDPWRRERQPTPAFLPGESHGRRSLEATVHGVAKSWTRPSVSHHHSPEYSFFTPTVRLQFGRCSLCHLSIKTLSYGFVLLSYISLVPTKQGNIKMNKFHFAEHRYDCSPRYPVPSCKDSSTGEEIIQKKIDVSEFSFTV